MIGFQVHSHIRVHEFRVLATALQYTGYFVHGTLEYHRFEYHLVNLLNKLI